MLEMPAKISQGPGVGGAKPADQDTQRKPGGGACAAKTGQDARKTGPGNPSSGYFHLLQHQLP